MSKHLRHNSKLFYSLIYHSTTANYEFEPRRTIAIKKCKVSWVFVSNISHCLFVKSVKTTLQPNSIPDMHFTICTKGPHSIFFYDFVPQACGTLLVSKISKPNSAFISNMSIPQQLSTYDLPTLSIPISIIYIKFSLLPKQTRTKNSPLFLSMSVFQ